jgi:hypothetical protein
MNSLRSALTAASPATNGPDIRAKENIRYELTQTQKPLDIDRPSHGRATRSSTRVLSHFHGSGRFVANSSVSTWSLTDWW